MIWWPLILWAISLVLIPVYGFMLYTVAKAWTEPAMRWLDGYTPTNPDVVEVKIAQEATRLGVWNDHQKATFLLHFLTEIDEDEKNKGQAKKSSVFWILVVVVFLSIALWSMPTIWGLAFRNLPMLLLGLLAWFMLWFGGLALLPVTWWLADWSRRYSGVVILSKGKSYAIKVVFTLIDFLTGGDPKFSIYPVSPEKVTQTPTSTDPEELARTAMIVTNEFAERLINWYLTPAGIIAVRMLALAAEYGRPMFMARTRDFWQAIDDAGDANVLNSEFAMGSLKDAGSEYRAKRQEGLSREAALSSFGIATSEIKEFKGPSVWVSIFELMKPDFVMPAAPQKQYRGVVPTSQS
jgi:hypothetical protein